MKCKNCQNEMNDQEIKCSVCGTLNGANFIPPKDTRKSLEKGFWNNETFSLLAIKYSRLKNYLTLLFGVFITFLAFSFGNNLFLHLVGLVIMATGGAGIYFSQKEKKKMLYTNCRKCNNEVKIGTQYCPKCREQILDQKIKGEIELQEALDKNKWKFQMGGSLNRKKLSLLLSAILIPILAVVLINFDMSLFSPEVMVVKDTSFNEFGNQTMKEVMEANMLELKWSHEKINDKYGFVYATGYNVYYAENMTFAFGYIKYDSYTSVNLERIHFNHSNQVAELYDMYNIMEEFYIYT